MRKVYCSVVGFLIIALSSPLFPASIRPAFEDVSIYRLQLRVWTSDVKNSSTDDQVWINLNSEDIAFFLNLSKNDRESGRVDVYDILSANIEKIRDIEHIKIGKGGRDAWNLRRIELVVNGKSIFKEDFGKDGFWLDNEHRRRKKQLGISSKTLRGSSNWKYNATTDGIHLPPVSLSASSLQSRIESLIGNSLAYVSGATWGKKYGDEFVSITKVDNYTVRFDLDLKGEGASVFAITDLPDPEIDVDFDLKFRCSSGRLIAKMVNLKTREDGISKHVYSPLDYVRDAILGGLSVDPVLSLKPGRSLGLRQVGEIFDFDFVYIDAPAVCIAALQFDDAGNLFLGKRQKPVVRDHRERPKQCSKSSSSACERAGATCEVVRGSDGASNDLCRWSSHDRSTCSGAGGIWTAAGSRYARNHPKAVPAGRSGACISEARNLGRRVD